MEEIEVGEYVRTNNKGIKRIDRIDNNKTVNKYLYFTGIEDFEGKEYGIIKTTDIVKNSKNPIDLIKKDDYVNGYKVIKLKDGFADGTMAIVLSNNTIIYRHHSEDIKTILTKEQFEANCYKVGGEDESN